MSYPGSYCGRVTDTQVWQWLMQDNSEAKEFLWRPFPGELGSSLLDWTLARRIPVKGSIDTQLQLILRASHSLDSVRFHYLGGSRPGDHRQIHPSLVFEVAGFPGIFVTGWCRRTRWIRTFRFDRMRLDKA